MQLYYSPLAPITCPLNLHAHLAAPLKSLNICIILVYVAQTVLEKQTNVHFCAFAWPLFNLYTSIAPGLYHVEAWAVIDAVIKELLNKSDTGI